jgi:Group II intron, maturase-specific domain/HNH endonuclease
MKEELNEFLSKTLRLTLSMEKTKVTHLNEGFEFLGFELKRSMCTTGIKTRLLIPKTKARKHLDKIKESLDPSTHEDSLGLKIVALNRIISGWCRYYQHTSKISLQLTKLQTKTFWLMAHWLGRKYQISMPTVMRRYYTRGLGLGTTEKRLTRHASFKRLIWKKGYLVPNPYTTMATIEREALSDLSSWTGYEARPGWADIRLTVLERDDFTCGLCKSRVTDSNAQVDHLLPYSHFKRPVDANRPENLWTLCEECHTRKTQRDRRMESRMQ